MLEDNWNDNDNDAVQTESVRMGKNITEGEKVNIGKEILSLIFYVLIILALTYVTINYVGQRTQVSGYSMETTLHDGDNLIVDKLSYRFSQPKRFDIIVFPYQYAENTYYIKRIIGLPGETIQIINSDIYINGEVLEEDYGKEDFLNNPGIAEDLIELGDGEYFVMGDNRNRSSDSRDSDVGIIKKENIIGRAFVRIWPLKDIGILKHQ